MATLKQIRQRIKSAKNIQQITRAMKLVAVARLTKAKNKAEQARAYFEKMREFVGSIGGAGDLPDNPLLIRRPVKKTVLVLITAERGMCGGFNGNLVRRAGDFISGQDSEMSLVCVGKKGRQFFQKRGFTVLQSITVPTSGPTVDIANELSDIVTELFVSGEADAIHICYSKFHSPIRQEPLVVQVLPIEPPEGDEAAGGEATFEPDAHTLLDLLLPKYLLTTIYQALLESNASEHGARMTAMTSATDNAANMITDLTMVANRARQAGITTQILEIVGGAEALKQ
ncbi:MAG: ATP synthase F1 subunit gamma [Armatimonadetes bacterium]|nr:ATP synthase F1 subunit gamma [Armatimonadota bacterium]